MKKPAGRIGHLALCQICSHPKLETILSLGHQALISSYLTAETLKELEVIYPLNFCRCPRCGLLQLDYIVDPQAAFHPAYPYHTGMTNMLIRNFRSLAEKTIRDYGLRKGNLVIDIGSNDGTLLRGFKEAGMRVLGIEPTNAAKVANRNKIPTIQKFFNKKTARGVLKKFGKARVIISTNAFAHINELFDTISGIKLLLDRDGVFISESQYLAATIEKLQFDCIYHEHLRYYSLKPMIKMFSMASMSVIDAERISAAGGSIRVYAVNGNKLSHDRVKSLLAAEEKIGLYDVKSKRLKEFARQAVQVKSELSTLLSSLKKKNKKIVGIGSPARSNSLLGFTKIDNDILDYACERKGSPKIGLFSPGMHIPVVDEKVLFQDQPDYALVLSWHIGDELMRKLRDLGYKGKFIIPLPKPKIITQIKNTHA